ncbi:MAG: response regulator transcription factor [Ramlibacter sp.]
MAQRIFIQVIGFTDEERHALNTVFRLSEQTRTMYQLWTPEAGEGPRVALLDGESYEARLAAESPLNRGLRMLWVGPHAPATVWRSVQRPIAWPEVIEAIDAALAAEDGVDLELGEPPLPMSGKHALIVSPDASQRLYLRARLALARVTLADEAGSAALALELARDRQYDVAVVDCAVGDADPWSLLRQLRTGRKPIPHVALTKAGGSLPERVRAWIAGADAFLDQPPHPARMEAFLSRL